MSDSEVLRVTALVAGYGARRVLNGVSLSLAQREFVCLIGRNGTGKSTLLRAIAGLKRYDGGQVVLDGQSIDGLAAFDRSRRGIASALQGHRVFMSMSVTENLELACQMAGRERGCATEAFARFPELARRAYAQACTLSGGMKQLLAVACCLVVQPRLILLDEPTLGLSESVAGEIFALLNRLREMGDVTLLLVEHRLREAIALSDRVIVLAEGRCALELRSPEALADWPQIERLF